MDKIFIDKLKNNFAKRNIALFFCENSLSAKNKIFEIMENFAEKSGKSKSEVSVSWGGSVTLHQIGVKDECAKMGYDVLDPYKFATPAEQNRAKKLALLSDVFLCGANAITEDGIIVNIDGVGNRVASLIYGPEKVIIAVGVNKIVKNVEEAYKRIKDVACPKNCVRLSRKTPCSKTGKCADCLINGETICSHTVITRRFHEEDRVKIVLIDEELGY